MYFDNVITIVKFYALSYKKRTKKDPGIASGVLRLGILFILYPFEENDC